ncbi:MAG: alanine/glycine:cation symporter family protein [Myxococcota bacterium]|nr:alanine/glycine:cation symporter family protein [Myxococcota bacterium]MDP6243252.1 alanine/glycine:cation symporter family protein [Myxococcota bacterium]MDP7073929.1 alanine/glycine:cation symporter family protein [Myxococcota bacterium]MDP7299383.1 alanine/glycine:cation symporter family protein [Myxococcota bacterium]MDP7434205.1 alanine/glycine:cation symporter family protein [Myxococcota bacterium]
MEPSAGFIQQLNSLFVDWIVAPLETVIFFDVAFWRPDVQVPLVVLWLILGATFFTLRFQFVNLRGFRHAIDSVRGVYSRPDESGEISHFQALSAALSATVGLGNIAGVAFAVGIGGPGAVFWMIVGGFLGMSSKFAECTLGQKYKIVRADGRVSGGPMHYLKDGLAELGLGKLGGFLAPLFALMCIGGSLGGGNMYQSNQAYTQVSSVLPFLAGTWGATAFGLLLAALVAVVIVGGIRRIGEVAAGIVPLMCSVYVLSGLTILLLHAAEVPAGLVRIVSSAFSFEAGLGGFVGILIQGFRRAAFSNEAGTGSAAIAHAAARTDEPIREGMVALLEPFVDTLIVCSMTGLVIVVTGAWNDPEAGSGIRMTSSAFATVLPWFPALLSVTATLFAFSTMISWSYYGEQCWAQLFGVGSIRIYQLIFLVFVWAGAVFQAKAVVDFGDMMILGMAFPNLVGVILLSGKVKADLDDYWRRLQAGELPRRRA